MTSSKPMSKRQLIDFISDNLDAGSQAGTLTLGPYEHSRRLGFLATEDVVLSNRIVKRRAASTQTYNIAYYKNDDPIDEDEVIVVKAGELFEVAVIAMDGEPFTQPIYVSFVIV